MNRPAFSLPWLLVPAVTLAMTTVEVAQAQGPAALVFDHVTVIDATGAPPRHDMRVRISDHRIVSIAPASTAVPAAAAMTIDAHGKYLIPGLWDFHVHTGRRDIYLPLYIANGVTGVRDMGGDLESPTGYGSARYVDLSLWREAIEQGTLLGPRMVLAGFLVDGYSWPGNITVITAQEGRQAVDVLHHLGVDFVKVKGDLSRDSYFAIADEARRQHMTLAGHVPAGVSAGEASTAGQKSIEHMNGIALASTSNEPALRTELELASQARDRDRYERALNEIERSYDGDAAARLFATLVKNRTWQVPTLVELRHDVLGFAVDDARWKFLPPSLREAWRQDAGVHNTDAAKARFAAILALTRKMHEAGVLILAGTDSANPSVVPGFSLHDELALLVEAGFTPMQALQAATVQPARYLGREPELGTIEVGQLADLVLLDANPLDDIANTRRIAAVVVDGRLIDRASLDTMLTNVEKLARAPGHP